MNILQNLLSKFIPYSFTDEVSQTETVYEEPSENYTIDVVGNVAKLSKGTEEDYKQRYFPRDSKLVCVPFKDDAGFVMYDPYVTQPITMHNVKATKLTGIDIYGLAVIFPTKEKPKAKRKRKTPSEPVQEKTPEIQRKTRRRSPRLLKQKDEKKDE